MTKLRALEWAAFAIVFGMPAIVTAGCVASWVGVWP